MPRSKDGRWQASCKGCGILFSPSRPKQKYHSRDCAELHRDDWARPKGGARIKADLDMRVCLNAGCLRDGEPFQPSRASQLTCSRRCRDALPEQRDRQHKRDRHPERRERQSELRREKRREETKEQARQRRFVNLRSNMRRVGVEVTWEDFVSWTANGRGDFCEVCDRLITGKNAHADHDHETGEFRGWLCHTCNRGMGFFGDGPELLRAAADYLERNRGGLLADRSHLQGACGDASEPPGAEESDTELVRGADVSRISSASSARI